MAYREYCGGCDTYGACHCHEGPEFWEARRAAHRAEQAAREEALREEGRQQERAAVLHFLREHGNFLAICGADHQADEMHRARDVIEKGGHYPEEPSPNAVENESKNYTDVESAP
jgi:hypothetical protein